MNDTSIPAFPVTPDVADINPPWLWTGMTLRDYFAAQVLNAPRFTFDTDKTVAQRAYSTADAMLAERAK